jgi:hypothetical protein
MTTAFMPTQREKMLAGETYDPFDPERVAGRARARDLCQQLMPRASRRKRSGGASWQQSACGTSGRLALLDDAPPGLAYRIVRDQQALNARRARAILEYLDFQPIEALLARGVLAGHGR